LFRPPRVVHVKSYTTPMIRREFGSLYRWFGRSTSQYYSIRILLFVIFIFFFHTCTYDSTRKKTYLHYNNIIIVIIPTIDGFGSCNYRADTIIMMIPQWYDRNNNNIIIMYINFNVPPVFKQVMRTELYGNLFKIIYINKLLSVVKISTAF